MFCKPIGHLCVFFFLWEMFIQIFLSIFNWLVFCCFFLLFFAVLSKIVFWFLPFWVIWFLLLSWILYIVWILTLSDTWFVNISFYSLGCFLTLLVIFLAVQKILMKSHWSIFKKFLLSVLLESYKKYAQTNVKEIFL